MSGGRVTLDRVKSWEYDDIDNKFAIKDLDKSSFKRGSHIPIKVRKVFECEDIKYGDKKINSYFDNKFGLNYQFLYAYKLIFRGGEGKLEYLKNKTIVEALPPMFKKVKNEVFKFTI